MPSRKVKFGKLKYALILLGIRYLWKDMNAKQKVKFCKLQKGFAQRKEDENREEKLLL